MKWTKLTLTTSPDLEEMVSALFLEIGASGIEVDAFKPASNSEDDKILKSKIEVSCYFPQDDLIGERIQKLKRRLSEIKGSGLKISPARLSIKTIAEIDWAESFKSFFKPQRVGKNILVSPTWHKPKLKPDDVVIWLNPGMAFGTGNHPTTKLCLQLLDEFGVKGADMIDIGTGSGILAIAAAKLGAKSLIATDSDPAAIEVAKDNFKLNSVSERIDIFCADLFGSIPKRFDLIMANIITKTILSLIPLCSKRMKKGGKAIFSGILDSEVASVRSALEANGFETVKVIRDGEWVAVSAKCEVRSAK